MALLSSTESTLSFNDFTVQMDDPGVALFVAMGNVACEKNANRDNCVVNQYLACSSDFTYMADWC